MKSQFKTTDAFPEPNFTQVPNRFFEMLKEDMESSEVRVTLVMIRETYGYHREAFKMGLGKLAAAAGLSRNAAKDGAEEAEKRGTFRRTNPDEQGEAEWELVVNQCIPPMQPVHTPYATSDPQVSVKEIKEIKQTQAGDEIQDETQTAEQINAPLFRGDFHEYPEHLWKVAEVLRDTWMFRLPARPQKKTKRSEKGEYAYFIQAMDDIKNACGEFGENVLIRVHADWKAKFKDGIAPYTVSQPSSLIRVCAGKAREMREEKTVKREITYTGDGIPESW